MIDQKWVFSSFNFTVDIPHNHSMDDILSRFVDNTGCDPSFARDLLEGKKWDFDEALKAFQEFSLGANKLKTSPTQRKKIPKPQRGISVVNSDIVLKARTKLDEDSHATNSQSENFEEMVRFSFVMPDLSSYPEDFAAFLREDLIETSALVTLEQSGHLNWWSDIGICQRLVPLATVGDGNCLLHAASLGMWGYHDRLLTLRKALLRTLVSDSISAAIKRRWRLQQYQRNLEAGGLVYSDDEWIKEWEEVLRLASTNRRKLNNTPNLNKNQSLPSIDEGVEKRQSENQNDPSERPKGELEKPMPQPAAVDKEKNPSEVEVDKAENTEIIDKEKKEDLKSHEENEAENEGAFESLEEIHVFVLAHVLRRPIIITADKFLRDFSGDPIAPIPFGGIYLPCECPPKSCLKTPLILAFESAHFSAIVASEGNAKESNLVTAIPLVNCDYQLLPIHFAVDPGECFDWETLDKETELPAKLSLATEQNIELLEKYLDIVNIKIPSSVKSTQRQAKADVHTTQKSSQGNEKKKEVVKDGEKGINSWLNSQFNKVGNLAEKIKGSLESSSLCAAKLKTNEKPEYYDEMIKNYIKSARERFEERKKTQELKKKSESGSGPSSQPCITPGCQMYGTADTNYLCSGCYRTQKNASEAGFYKKSSNSEAPGDTKSTLKSYLPPISTYLQYPNYPNFDCISNRPKTLNVLSSSTPKVQPPSYSEACQSKLKAGSNKCLKEGCSFYGRPEQKGYCSSCFKKMSEEKEV